MKESPESFNFMERMEVEHKHTNAIEHGIEEPIRIFRNNMTVEDIRALSQNAVEPVDDSKIYEVNGDLFGYDDFDSCGSESCEVY